MKPSRRINWHSSPCSILSLLLLVLWSPSWAMEGKLPTLRLSYTGSYDDNILKYSQKDLDRFHSNSEPHPSEIITTDDWINAFQCTVYRDFDVGRRIVFSPYYSFRISLYAVNQLKDSRSHYLRAGLIYRQKYRFYADYYFQPSYYLRIYEDRDSNSHQRCEFDLERASLKLILRYPTWQLEGAVGWESSFYNQYFTEYDSRASFARLVGFSNWLANLDLSLGYEFKSSNNVGFDPLFLTPVYSLAEDAQFGDGSFKENGFRLVAFYHLSFVRSWLCGVKVDLQHKMRRYESGYNSLYDPLHSGRRDELDILGASFCFFPETLLEFELRFTFEQRRTSSPLPVVEELKSFVSRTVALSATYQVF